MKLSALGMLSVVAMLSVGVGCGAAEGGSEETVEAVDAAEDDYTSVAALLGNYAQGRGQLVELSLTQIEEGSKKKNRFSAKRATLCADAECPTEDVTGSWYTRSGRITFYYDDGDELSAKVSLQDDTLTLRDGSGTSIAVLTRVIPAADGIDEILANRGVPSLTVEITAEEIAAHGTPTVSFTQAFDLGLEFFLTDEAEGLPGVLSAWELDEVDDACEGGSAESYAEVAICIANSSDASASLYAPNADTPPGGESPNDNWVINFYASFSDHGYFAVVPKDGSSPSFYSFN